LGILKDLRRRWHFFRNREQFHAELDEEMRFHLEEKIRNSGGPRSARIQFGNTTHLRERSDEVWGLPRLESLYSDIRHTFRGFRKSPAFAGIAIGTLALAIGGGTAIVSLAEAVFLRPLPYPGARELTLVFEGSIRQNTVRGDTSPGTYRALRESMSTLRTLALYQPNETSLTGEGEPERLDAVMATANFFSTVGVQPHLGRFFHESEELPGKSNVAVLSYELWQRRFAGKPEILNSTIQLGEVPHTVVGVLPPQFRFYLDRGELWTPFSISPQRWANRGSRYVYLVGRRTSSTSIAEVQGELDALSARFRQEFPRECSTIKLQAVDLHDRLTEESRTSLYFLLAAVFALLLIACSNVSGLLLTRAVARGAEISVRKALGASTGRIVRQLLTETLVLALLAAAASLFVAVTAFRVLQPLVPPGMLAFTRLELTATVIVVQFLLALFCTAASGLVPALRATGTLTTRAIGGRHHDSIRSSLIVAEIALAVLLLTGATLLFRTFVNLNNVDPGFQPDQLLSAQTVLPSSLSASPEMRSQYYRTVLERVSATPGIISAAFASSVPTTWKGGFSSITVEGRINEPGTSFPMMRQVAGDYFHVMGIPLLEGRSLTAGDRANSPLVSVVNRAMADRFWPGENAIGKRFHRGDAQSANPWVTVVGVVGNVREMGLAAPPPAITYFPESQQPSATFSSPVYLIARTSGNPSQLAPALRKAVHDTYPQQSVAKLRPVTEVLASETQQRRLQSAITISFASVALLLACLGIYGVLAYTVAQRRQEFGVRLALGASHKHLLSMVMGSGLRLIVTGMAIGLLTAALLAKLIESLLFQVRPWEPSVFVSVAAIVVSTAMVACWVPAQRIRRIEPAQALRYD